MQHRMRFIAVASAIVAAMLMTGTALAADPDNFDAVRVYILALTDSFPNHDGNNASPRS